MSETVAADEQLRLLLSANREIVGELSLPAVLQRIVAAARDLVGAQYAALGILNRDGQLEDMIHLGTDEETVRRIGVMPQGHGILGALIEHPHPIRIDDVASDPRSSGFPPGHPQLNTFLGVPIRSRDEVFGDLYLAGRSGGPFTATDEDLVLSLAATAGIAIENARLYEESRRRELWLQASAEISSLLLAPTERDPLHVIAQSVKVLADADVVTIVVPTGREDVLEVAVATGDGEERLRGMHYPTDQTLAQQAMRSGHGIQLHSVDQQQQFFVHLSAVVEVGPVMAVPLSGESGSQGALVVGRRKGRSSFGGADLDMVEAFASHAAIAIELVEARADQQRLAVLLDRDRIARDLHDHVIQRLFAAGLSLQSMAAVTDDKALVQRLGRVVEDIDDTMGQIRTSIFELRDVEGPLPALRSSVLRIVRRLTPLLGFTPQVQFRGPADTLLHGSVVGDVEAVVREALTNVAKHARATELRLEVRVNGGSLTVDVLDDGVGLAEGEQRRSGLQNLKRRAEQLGGTLHLSSRTEGGTMLRWTIPLGS